MNLRTGVAGRAGGPLPLGLLHLPDRTNERWAQPGESQSSDSYHDLGHGDLPEVAISAAGLQGAERRVVAAGALVGLAEDLLGDDALVLQKGRRKPQAGMPNPLRDVPSTCTQSRRRSCAGSSACTRARRPGRG